MGGSASRGTFDTDVESGRETGRFSDFNHRHQQSGALKKKSISKKLTQAIKNSDFEKLHNLNKNSNEDILTRLGKQDKFNTALHYSVQNKKLECLKYLLELNKGKKSSHFINLPNSDGDTALHLAVKDHSMEMIGHLQKAGANINLRDDFGNTPLHLLANFLSQEKMEMKPFLDCFSKWRDIDWDPLNFDRKTPLEVAAESLRQNQSYRTQIEEFCTFLIERNANVSDDVKVLLNGIDVNAIGKIQGDNIASSQSKMLNYIIEGDIDEVESIFDLENNDGKFRAKEAINDFIGSRTLLYHVVDQNNLELVKYIVENLKPEYDKKNVNGEEPLHLAFVRKDLDLTKCIIEHLKKKPTFDLVHLEKTLEVDEKGPGERLKFLRELLKSNLFSDISDDALEVAHERNFHEGIVLLISYGAYIGDENGMLKKMIGKDILIEAFDEIMMQSQNENDTTSYLSQKHKVELNYKFLYSSKTNQNSILTSIQEEFELELLKHSLMQVYQYVKWRNMIKYHVGSIIFHILIIFFTFMSANSHLFTPSKQNSRVDFNSTGNTTEDELKEKTESVELCACIILTILTFFLLAKKLIQVIFKCYKIKKSKNIVGAFENILYIFLDLEWVILVLNITFVILQYFQMNDYKNEISEELINHFSAWIMLTNSFFAFWKMGRVPQFTFYIYFMEKVTRNFLKLLFPVLIVFFAFAASFYSVFKTRTVPEESDELTDFSNIWRSFARTFVMSTGEFEYSKYSVGQEEFSTLAFFSSVIMYLLFIFLLAIVLMNVLTGLAVNDAEDMKDKIFLQTKKMQLEETINLKVMKMKSKPAKLIFDWIDGKLLYMFNGKLSNELNKEERKITIYINKHQGRKVKYNAIKRNYSNDQLENDGNEQPGNDGNEQLGNEKHGIDFTDELDSETLKNLRSYYFKKLSERKSHCAETSKEEVKSDVATPNISEVYNEVLKLTKKQDRMESIVTNILEKLSLIETSVQLRKIQKEDVKGGRIQKEYVEGGGMQKEYDEGDGIQKEDVEGGVIHIEYDEGDGIQKEDVEGGVIHIEYDEGSYI